MLLLFMVTALFSHRLEATTLDVDLAQNVGKQTKGSVVYTYASLYDVSTVY